MVYARAALIGALSSAAVIGGIMALVRAGHADIHSAAAFTAITVSVTAPTAYFLKNVLGERAEKRRVIMTICGELRDVLDALDRRAHRHNALSLLTDGKREVFFMNVRLGHDLYDSMVFPGKLHLIDPGLHRRTQYVYSMIKHHNEYLTKLWALTHDGGQLPDVEGVCGWLDEAEMAIMKEIPALVRDLEGSV